MSRPKKKQVKPAAKDGAVEKPEPPPNRVVRDGTPSAKVTPDVPTGSSATRVVPDYRRCPLCWGRDKGVGVAQSNNQITSTKSIRYYKCNTCSHHWSIPVYKGFVPFDQCKIDVEHHKVEVEFRHP